MRYYELTINTKEAPKENKFPTGQADALLEKVVSYLPSPPLREQKTHSWLALEFYAEPEKIQELEKKLRADSLKYLILAKESPKKIAESPKKPRRVTAGPKPKVELNEIEKKLEEILKE